MSVVFDYARPSSEVTLGDEYISTVVCILLGLVQPEFDIKLSTKLLVSNFMLFPSGDPVNF